MQLNISQISFIISYLKKFYSSPKIVIVFPYG